MPFGETPDVWVEFNTYEALFWFTLGIGLFVLMRHLKTVSRAWVYFSSCNIIVFGITDVIELYTGGFLHTAPWLLYWKTVHVFGLLLSLVWYVKVRVYDRRSVSAARR